MYCSKCGKEIPNEATFCPECGTKFEEEKAKKVTTHPIITGCLSLIGFILIVVFFATSFNDLNNIENQVAEDAVKEYNIAKQQGDKSMICVQAGVVSAAYLQAKDQENYNKWKSIEKSDCAYMMP